MIAKQEKIVDHCSIEQGVQAWHPEEELTRDYGSNSLAFFGQTPQNSHFLTPDGAGLVHYRLLNKVAIVLGDPVCAPETGAQVTQSYLDFCARHHWYVAFYQASPAYLAAYHALGLRV